MDFWLPKCNSIRTTLRWAEPEVWFRIVHIAADGRHGSSPVTYCQQTVEIALGPKGAFESGNIRAVTRRVAAERVVSAVPRLRRPPKPPRGPRTPRVVDLLRKAIAWQSLLQSAEVPSQAAIARREGITRARVTQVMGLLRLTPEIQQHILSMPEMVRRPPTTERALRPITRLDHPRDQKAKLRELFTEASHAKPDSRGAAIVRDSRNLISAYRRVV